MLSNKFNLSLGALALAAAGSAWAAGFEKANLWSGHYQGIGGAAASSVNDSQALFFNPAGLVSDSNDVSFNVSPTFAQSKSPVFTNNTTVDGKRVTVYPFGLTGKYNVNPDLAVGAGLFLSGGFEANYGELDFSSIGVTGLKPEYSSNIQLLEFSPGVAYRILPGLNVGLGWRATFVRANFHLPTTTTVGTSTAVVGIAVTDLSASNYTGFRLGVQYAPADMPFGIGAQFRSAVDFTAKGKVNAQLGLGAATATGTEGDASVKNTFPYQFVLGGHYNISKDWTAFLQYEYTNYSTDKSLDFTGTSSVTTQAGVVPVALSAIPQEWKNQHMVRVAGEYKATTELAIRAGYVYTSQVTSSTYPRGTFFAPGAGNTFVVGAGYLIGKDISTDAAFEYSKDSGSPTAVATGYKTGEYTASAYTIHLGGSYHF
ncbi:MAG: outer membrane protein transport protein [Bdellovibrionales bacterium]|nr:outer membrane protein transport protein [Bdellovibrionales bacterium]